MQSLVTLVDDACENDDAYVKDIGHENHLALGVPHVLVLEPRALSNEGSHATGMKMRAFVRCRHRDIDRE